MHIVTQTRADGRKVRLVFPEKTALNCSRV